MGLDEIEMNDVAQDMVDELENKLTKTFNLLGVGLEDSIFYVFRYPLNSIPKGTNMFLSLSDVAKYIIIDRNKIDPCYSHIVMDKDGHMIRL